MIEILVTTQICFFFFQQNKKEHRLFFQYQTQFYFDPTLPLFRFYPVWYMQFYFLLLVLNQIWRPSFLCARVVQNAPNGGKVRCSRLLLFFKRFLGILENNSFLGIRLDAHNPSMFSGPYLFDRILGVRYSERSRRDGKWQIVSHELVLISVRRQLDATIRLIRVKIPQVTNVSLFLIFEYDV